MALRAPGAKEGLMRSWPVSLLVPYDDPDLLFRVVDIATEDGTVRGIPLGSVWTVDGEVREDTRGWLAEKAEAAGWYVRAIERVGGREFWAALPPKMIAYVTHLGEGDVHELGTCSARDARAIVDAFNARRRVPDLPGAREIAAEARRVHARWTEEGDPHYYVETLLVDDE
jgi:hypothetical protein